MPMPSSSSPAVSTMIWNSVAYVDTEFFPCTMSVTLAIAFSFRVGSLNLLMTLFSKSLQCGQPFAMYCFVLRVFHLAAKPFCMYDIVAMIIVFEVG